MNREPTTLPERIARLRDLAGDLSWSWNPPARDLFRQLDYRLWRLTDHNPVRLLNLIPAEQLQRAAANPTLVALYDRAIENLEHARSGANTWWSREAPDADDSL